VERRSRLLPARVVVYYVLALCLFFGDGYEEVMRRLVGGLQWLGSWRGDWQVPSAGAIAQVRCRLSAEPLKVLFERLAVPMTRPGTQGAWLGERRLMAIDGLVLDVPDTKANAAGFGRPSGDKFVRTTDNQRQVAGARVPPPVEFERYADDADGRGRAATAPRQDQDRVLQCVPSAGRNLM